MISYRKAAQAVAFHQPKQRFLGNGTSELPLLRRKPGMEKRSYSIFDPPVSVRAGPFVTDGSLAAFFTHLLKITHIFLSLY